ncbi:zf-HC2 domain-containing protein [Methylibium sp.]|uniref:zf-HC2 domain-containing protein n=1 Tax=Methylibium sp. TaxID=2067992 RepID=UPI003D1079E6
MTRHLSPEELAAFRAHTLSVGDLLAFDDHLQSCETCRAALCGPAELRAARRLLQALRLPPAHLRYEDMEAHVDAALPADGRARVEAHLAVCGRCRDEWQSLKDAAPQLAAALAARPLRGGAVEQPGRIARWLDRLRMPTLARVAFAVFAAAVVFAVWRPVGDGVEAPPGTTLDRSAAGADGFEGSVLQRADRLPREIGMAYRAGDAAQAAVLLRPLAEQGQPAAQTALGCLLATGQGVPRDDAQAERWWLAAAASGEAAAAFNLGTLYERRPDPQRAREWFERAASLKRAAPP